MVIVVGVGVSVSIGVCGYTVMRWTIAHTVELAHGGVVPVHT